MSGPIWGYGYYPDIDYTSGDSFLVHWYGFLDHESNIKLYRLALAERCLSTAEVAAMNTTSDPVFADILFPDNGLEINASFTGTRYVSVIALNNAMDPSDAVCSDGITRDISPPEISDIRIAHASWSDSIYCHNNDSWLLRSDLMKVKLPHSDGCECSSDSNSPLVEALPIQLDINDYQSVADKLEELNRTLVYLCSVISSYDSSEIIYLPNDHINLQWNVVNGMSQTDEYLVGFGRSPEERDAPGLLDYVSTHTKRFFEIRHAAIGTDEEFFMFLKAVNKAGLETIIPIGPLLIDETPPKVKSIPKIYIDAEEILVGWENDTFIDDEQTSPVNKITLEIGKLQLLIQIFGKQI